MDDKQRARRAKLMQRLKKFLEDQDAKSLSMKLTPEDVKLLQGSPDGMQPVPPRESGGMTPLKDERGPIDPIREPKSLTEPEMMPDVKARGKLMRLAEVGTPEGLEEIEVGEDRVPDTDKDEPTDQEIEELMRQMGE